MIKKYLTIIINPASSNIKTSEICCELFKGIIEEFPLTYERFLFPYADRVTLMQKPCGLFDRMLIEAEYIDEDDFKAFLEKNKFTDKIHYKFSNKSDSDLILSDTSNVYTGKYSMKIEIGKEIFLLPDYRIREFSRKLMSFHEICARELKKIGCIVNIACGVDFIFDCDESVYTNAKKRLNEIFDEKISSSYFDNFNINVTFSIE